MKIFKYPLKVTDFQKISMPRGAQILSVQTQYNEPQVWALVDENAPHEPKEFVTYGTGNSFPEVFNHGRFIGTYQYGGSNSPLVFHVFVRNE